MGRIPPEHNNMLIIGKMEIDGMEYRGRAVKAPATVQLLKDPNGIYFLGVEGLPPLQVNKDAEELLAALVKREGSA